MEPSFEKLLVLLASSEVKFILVGGLAVTLQGYVRLTDDVDILIDSDLKNIEQLIATLSHYGEGYARELTVSDFDDSEGAIRIVEEIEQCQIDIFTRMAALSYADIITDAEVFMLRNISIYYASKKSLIHWKAHSDREKDRIDAAALRCLIEDPRCFD